MIKTHGIILLNESKTSVLLLHPTGSDMLTWSIPKGLAEPGESAPEAAIREFEEETGTAIYDVSSYIIPLGVYPYPTGKKALVAYGTVQTKPFKKEIDCICMFDNNGVPTPECDAYMWASLTTACEFMTDPQYDALQYYLTKYVWSVC